MNVLWRNLAILNDLISLHNRHLCVFAHSLIEVVLCLAELAVAQPVCLCNLDECVIAEDRLLHDVRFAVEFACLLCWCHLRDCAIGVVAYG
jgi:hypothetical protein